MAEKYPFWSPYNYTLDNPITKIDSDGRNPIKYFIKTVKNTWKQVNRNRAIIEAAKDKRVFVTGSGKSKAARKLMKDAKPGAKLKRHDPHKPGQKPHWQKKTGGGGKALYNTLNAIIGSLILGIFETPLAGNQGPQGVGNPGEDLDGDGQDDSTQEVWSPGYIPDVEKADDAEALEPEVSNKKNGEKDEEKKKKEKKPVFGEHL